MSHGIALNDFTPADNAINTLIQYEVRQK